MALGSVWFTTRYRGFATGITSSGTGIGTMLGAFIVPYLLVMFGATGWRYAWFCLGALLLVIGIVCFGYVRGPSPSVSARWAWSFPSTVTSTQMEGSRKVV